MLLLGSSFAKFQLLSLRTGTVVGSVVGHLINPHNLKVDALWVRIGGFKKPGLLVIQDIREVSPKGVIIDDHDVILDTTDAVRLKKIIDLQFELLDKKVISGKFSIGKVADYALERDGFTIQKLYVEPNLWNKIKTNRLTIDRSQVIEVSQRYVKVKSSDIKQKQTKRREIPQPVSTAPVFNSATIDE